MRLTSNLQSYGLATIACVLAFALAWQLDAPSSCFVLAVMVSTLYGGRGPGLWCAAVSSVAFGYFILTYRVQPASGLSSCSRFAVLVGALLLVNYLVSAKLRSDEARRKSDEHYRVVAETALDAILSVDDKHQILFANAAAAKIFGWSVSELIGRPLAMVLAGFPSDGTSKVTELAGRRKDGTEFTAEVSFVAVAEDGQHGFTGFVRDISERKRAEEALRTSEHNLRLMVNSIPGLVSTMTGSGDLELANKQVMEYTGKTVEEIKNWLPTIHPDDRALTAKRWRHSVETGDPFDVETRVEGADGGHRWFHARGLPWRNADGHIVRWYILLTDIDDRKNMEDALRSTQARLSRATQIATVGELAASIAHEVNQPLTAVVANAHACLLWLSAQPPNMAEVAQAVDRIIRNGNSAAEVVRRIRALFRRAEAETTPLDLNEVFAEVVRLLRGEIAKRGVIVQAELEEDLPSVMADRLQLQQVIFNLMQNGIEAMDTLTDRPKKLVIRSRRQDTETVLIEIRDYGAGLNDFDKSFEAFYTTKQNGLGMGLAICRSIIDAHHGHLWATPTEGPGATFCFTLPLQSAHTTLSSGSSARS
jgi:PAS domain S-box-containing protein